MSYTYRDANEADLPRIVEIYNLAVATRKCSCDLHPITVSARRAAFLQHTPNHRPLWVADDPSGPGQRAVGYLGFFHFMNDLPPGTGHRTFAIAGHRDADGNHLCEQRREHRPLPQDGVRAMGLHASRGAAGGDR
jgi:phosphinothricin acetyltransferase